MPFSASPFILFPIPICTEWTNPQIRKIFHIHNCAPSVLRDSPHLFGNVLAKELRKLQLTSGTFLQYVDDLLISSTNKNSILVLHFPENNGYKVSPKKAQITSQWVQCLGYLLTPKAWTLSPQRKKGPWSPTK